MADEIVVREEQIKSTSDTLAVRAKALAVVDEQSLAEAGAILQAARQGMKAVDEAFDPIIAKQRAALDEARGKKAQYRQPFEEAEKETKLKAGQYRQEQERIAQEERARLMREAREREETARLAQAAALEEAGMGEAAQQVMDAPVMISVPQAPKVLTPASGFGSRRTWKAEVIDKAALFAFAAAHPEWQYLFDVNGTALNGAARAQKSALSLPGARVYEDVTTTAARS